MEERLDLLLHSALVEEVNSDFGDERLLLFGKPVPPVELMDSCSRDPVFLHILRTFIGLSCYLQRLRAPFPLVTGKIESEFLNKLEQLHLPTQDTRVGQIKSNEEYLFWIVIRENLRTGEPISTIIRRVEDRESESRRNLTECCEIALNLFRCYVLHDYSMEQDLLKKMKKDLCETGLELIEGVVPPSNWFTNYGTSIYIRIYQHLPLPQHLMDIDIPGSQQDSLKLSCYVNSLVNRIIGENDLNPPHIHYSDLSSEDAKRVRDELTKVIAHVPYVIKNFLNCCGELPVTVAFSFPIKGMEKKVAQIKNCSVEEAKSLVRRLKLVLDMFEAVGLKWETVPRVDLIGLSLLLREGLLTFICRQAPTFNQLQTLKSIIMSHDIRDPDANCILPLIITDVYVNLNEALFKAKMEVVASLVTYRLALEKLWDQHTFLLRTDMYEFLKEKSPRLRDHEGLIAELEAKLEEIENMNTNPNKSSKRWSLTQEEVRANEILKQECERKIVYVEADLAGTEIGVLMVLMEIGGKLCYISKTYYGNPIQLVEHAHEYEIQGLDLEENADGLFTKIMSFLSVCRTEAFGCKIKITLGLITTTCKAGGILAVAANEIGISKTHRLFTLPSRIFTFYEAMDERDPHKLMEQAWNCFSTNLGHFSLMLRKSIHSQTQDHQGQHQDNQQQQQPKFVIECEYQLEDKQVCYMVLCSLLHVAAASKRINYIRCFNDLTYNNVIQFLIQCSSERMEQIKSTIMLVRNTMEDQEAREMILRRFSKENALQLLGLNALEIRRFGHLFYWEDHYPFDEVLRKCKVYFNMLLTQEDKAHLFHHLQSVNEAPQHVTYYKEMFISNILGESGHFFGISYDKYLRVRVNYPKIFFRTTNQNGIDFVKFGSQTEEIFKNVDFYSFKCESVLKFTVKHLPIRTYLVPLVASFPQDFPQDVREYAIDKDQPSTANIVTKSQLFVLCCLKKRLGLSRANPEKGQFFVTPMFMKHVNTIIIDLQPPSDAHHFDVVTSLLNLAYLDKGRSERIAGREIPISKLTKTTLVSDAELNSFRQTHLQEVENKFLGTKIDEDTNILSVMEPVAIPDLKKHLHFDGGSMRLKFSTAKLYGGYPSHLEEEKDEYYPMKTQ